MDEYYLQDSRFFLGNTVVWWCQDGGFTVDTSKAKVFTRAEAYSWHAIRESDIPWPKEYIDTRIKPTVDLMDIDRREGERSIKSTATKLPSCHHCDDIVVEATCAANNCARWVQLHNRVVPR